MAQSTNPPVHESAIISCPGCMFPKLPHHVTRNSGLEQQRFIFSQLCGLDVWQSRCQQVRTPRQALEESPSLLLQAASGSWWSLARGCITPICTSIFTWSSLLCLLSLMKTPVFGFGTHSKSRMISSQDLYLIISTKTLFSNQITSCSFGKREFGVGGTIPPTALINTQKSPVCHSLVSRTGLFVEYRVTIHARNHLLNDKNYFCKYLFK